MRTLAVSSTVAATALLLAGCAATAQTAAPAPAAAPAPIAAPVPGPAPAAIPADSRAPIVDPVAGVNPVTTTVTRVIDGDTVEVTGGQRVRVLGIDSCEIGSDAGDEATGSAAAVLSGATVVLTQEPGVDLDRYQRALRYVTMYSGDFGEYMVVFDHTGVYQGDNDAAAAYVAELRSLDTNGRTCDDAAPVAPAPVGDDDDQDLRPAAAPDTEDDSSENSSRPRSGGSGHACLPGERDGDGDGYCGEG